MSCLLKQFQYEMLHQKTLAKNHLMFSVQSWRFQHFRHISINLKPKLMEPSVFAIKKSCIQTTLSPTCVMREHLYYIMSLSQYNGCCQYHQSIYTMTQCPYHESLIIPWVHVYTMSTCLYHDSMCIPWVLVNIMHLFSYHESWPITWVNVYRMIPGIQITKNIFVVVEKIQFSVIQKCRIQKYRNINNIYT